MNTFDTVNVNSADNIVRQSTRSISKAIIASGLELILN